MIKCQVTKTKIRTITYRHRTTHVYSSIITKTIPLVIVIICTLKCENIYCRITEKRRYSLDLKFKLTLRFCVNEDQRTGD